MRWLAILIVAFAPLLVAQEAVAPERLNTLVSNLASEDWATRERASRELIGIGEPARQVLEKALTHDDAEVRTRASNALIQIGESFASAVQNAGSEVEELRNHGRASLMHLFRLNDDRTLRELSPAEYQPRYGWSNENISLTGPPPIVLLRLQLLSSLPIIVAPEARERWAKLLAQGGLQIYINGDMKQLYWTRQALWQGLQNAMARDSAESQLSVKAMRIGRASFFYIATAASGRNVARNCADHLVNQFLAGGPQGVEAAWILALGTTGESEVVNRVRAEFAADPASSGLLWLALAMGEAPAVTEAVRKQDHKLAAALLEGDSWCNLQACERYMQSLTPEQRGKALSTVIENSSSTLGVTAAMYLAKGAPLEPAARTRLASLLSSTEDAVAAGAVSWLGTAEDITDSELDAVWTAAQSQKLDSSFPMATLELVRRPEISSRLVERARVSLSQSSTQQALAAAVLAGRATLEDYKIVLGKLKAALNQPRLASLLAAMLKDCSELDQAAIDLFVSGLLEANAEHRRLFLSALSGCAAPLRKQIAEAALGKLPAEPPSAKPDAGKPGEDKPGEVPPAESAKPATPVTQAQRLARVALTGMLAGTGDATALDGLWGYLRGEDAEMAKAAGAALNDAMAGDVLFGVLKELQGDKAALHGVAASQAGCMETARRAAQVGDRNSFRRAQAIALGIQNQDTWRVQNDLARLETQLNSAISKSDDGRLLPRDMLLRNLLLTAK